jgi:hypothetical protein
LGKPSWPPARSRPFPPCRRSSLYTSVKHI